MHGRISRISNIDGDDALLDEQVWYYPPIASEAGSRDWMLDSRERCVWRGKRNGGADSTWTERIEGCRSAEVLLQLVSGVAVHKAPRSWTLLRKPFIIRKGTKTHRGRERDSSVRVRSRRSLVVGQEKGNRACHERPFLGPFFPFARMAHRDDAVGAMRARCSIG
jgi:hypothetical protein